MRLCILDCDLDADERNTALMMLPLLKEVRAEIFRACEGRFPPDPATYDAFLITGSAANVDQEDAWIRLLEGMIRRIHQAGIPLLGVCFGHETIAQALGGTVEPMGATEFGYEEILLTKHPLFTDFPSPARLFQYHSYRVASLPPGANPLAENSMGNQAFALGSSLGVQFHPEIGAEAARAIARRSGKDVAALERQIPLSDTGSGRIFGNFLRLATRHNL